MKYRDWCNRDYICLLDVLELRCKGYIGYYWCSHVNNLEEVKALNNDQDVIDMANAAVDNGGYVHIYLVENSDAEVEKEEKEK